MADRREHPHPLLLIDDDPTFSGFIAKGLERAGLPTTVASTGQSGLEALQTGRYPLVLLDLVLPDIDGLEVLRRVNTWRPTPSVILLSGHGSIRTAVEGIRLGALDFLEKPLSVLDLVDTVRSHLPAVTTEADGNQADTALHDLVRWLMVVVTADADTRTIGEWSQQAGASTPTIFARCAVAGIRAKSLLDLGRLLRIAQMPRPRPKDLVDALRTRDIRTVGSLLQRAGIAQSDLDGNEPATLLTNQQLVVDPRLLALLSSTLRQVHLP